MFLMSVQDRRAIKPSVVIPNFDLEGFEGSGMNIVQIRHHKPVGDCVAAIAYETMGSVLVKIFSSGLDVDRDVSVTLLQ
jgi:hypothetical protein